MPNYCLAIHGGAGTILRSQMTPEKESNYLNALRKALERGKQILEAGGSALDASEAAVVELEENPLFNAGRGAVFTHHGTIEMEASIMCGKTLNAGAAALVKNLRNPIRLARRILEESEHVFLVGQGAEVFAREHQLEFMPDGWFFSHFRHQQLEEAREHDRILLDHSDQKFGTVGAVARDKYGNLAAATSTGGMTNKKYGRIGDSPLIGCGGYANNETAAISCTGHGEFFIRGVVAYDVSCLMEYRGASLREACKEVIHQRQVRMGGSGGLIAVSQTGEPVLVFNSEGMYRGWVQEGGPAQLAIYK